MQRLVFGTLMCVACSSASGPAASVDGGVTAPDAPLSPAATDVTHRAAASICSALFRCCDDDLVEYFAPYRGNDLLAQFKDRLPPAATLDEASCASVVE